LFLNGYTLKASMPKRPMTLNSYSLALREKMRECMTSMNVHIVDSLPSGEDENNCVGQPTTYPFLVFESSMPLYGIQH